MKLTLAIAAIMLATTAGAERLDTSGFYGTGRFGSAPDAYTPSNPSPSRGGTYDGDDGPPVLSIPHHDGNIDSLLLEARDRIEALEAQLSEHNELRCQKCGRKQSEHNYRHPFVPFFPS